MAAAVSVILWYLRCLFTFLSAHDWVCQYPFHARFTHHRFLNTLYKGSGYLLYTSKNTVLSGAWLNSFLLGLFDSLLSSASPSFSCNTTPPLIQLCFFLFFGFSCSSSGLSICSPQGTKAYFLSPVILSNKGPIGTVRAHVQMYWMETSCSFQHAYAYLHKELKCIMYGVVASPMKGRSFSSNAKQQVSSQYKTINMHLRACFIFWITLWLKICFPVTRQTHISAPAFPHTHTQ